MNTDRTAYSIREAAEKLHINYSTLYQAIRQGHVPCIRITPSLRLVPAWFVHGLPEPSRNLPQPQADTATDTATPYENRRKSPHLKPGL